MEETDNRLSLFFDLVEGEKADLEVVAAAAIAWVEALRASALAYDPDSQVKVEMIDADEGSLIFNTIIDWFDRHLGRRVERVQRGFDRMPRRRKLALALALFIITTGYPTFDFYFGDDDKLSDEDREFIRDLVEAARNDPGVEVAKRKFYRTLERDPAIKAVGIKESAKSAALMVVPSERFAEAGGLWDDPEQDVQERVLHPTVRVVLVKPALVHTARAWTFKPDGLPEFDAVMRDARVLQAIQDNGFPERLREGIPMTLRLEVKEVLVDGQWRAIRGGRSVLRVLSPKLD